MKIVIPGNCPSKKNSKRIVTNRKTNKPFIISSKRHEDWHKYAIPEMKRQFAGYRITEYPIGIKMTFYWKDLRRHDIDNGLATILDALKDANIIEDDDSRFVNTVEGKYGGLDRLNPRVEIYIDE